MARPIRVLVVDDSAVMRQFVSMSLRTAEDIEVVGMARDGEDGLSQARALRPDVITLDVLMPVRDGLWMLGEVMAERPVPIVMFSSVTQEGAEPTLRALELGAVDFLPKPQPGVLGERDRAARELIAKVRRASLARPRSGRRAIRESAPVKMSMQVAGSRRADLLVVIGSSTGGPRALSEVIPALPRTLEAAVLIVQHMPPDFTGPMAARLDAASELTVREAIDGDALAHGLALVAPGDRHLVVESRGRVRLHQEPPLHGVRPAVDVTLESAAARFGDRTLSVILTGMGVDGANGSDLVKRAGGAVVAEDASTCVVYGMPRAVLERGVCDLVVPLNKIAGAIQDWTDSWKSNHNNPTTPATRTS